MPGTHTSMCTLPRPRERTYLLVRVHSVKHLLNTYFRGVTARVALGLMHACVVGGAVALSAGEIVGLV